MNEPYERAVAAIDAAHEADPAGKELAYGQSVLGWIERLHPQADDLLRLCARAQHLERWVIPRDSRPMDRKGYHAWRTAVAHRQGERLQDILERAGYPTAEAERAGMLVAKRIDRGDPDAQALEDAACLVFLDEQAEDFAAGKSEEQLLRILRRTWAKMSAEARDHALRLPLPATLKALVGKALD